MRTSIDLHDSLVGAMMRDQQVAMADTTSTQVQEGKASTTQVSTATIHATERGSTTTQSQASMATSSSTL